MNNTNLKEFIEIILIKNIGKIQSLDGRHYKYMSFGLISQGIEFLGSFFDKSDIFEKRMSFERFKKTFSELFLDKRYEKFCVDKKDSNYKYDIYSNLRCGLLHVLLPNTGLLLAQEDDPLNISGKHLQIIEYKGRNVLVLVAEIFYRDFVGACNEMMKKIDSGELENVSILTHDTN